MNNSITKTTIENVKKYLKEKNIKVNYSDDEKLFEFAKLLRNNEKIDLMRKEKQLKGIEQLEISAILKTEYFDERFFYSEGIQEVDYSKYDKLFLNFIPGEELYNHNKLLGTNYFEFFSSFIDILPNYCRVRTNNGNKTMKKNDLLEIFEDVKLYIVNEHKQLLEKLMIKEFIKDCLYRKQFYEMREENQKRIMEKFKSRGK